VFQHKAPILVRVVVGFGFKRELDKAQSCKLVSWKIVASRLDRVYFLSPIYLILAVLGPRVYSASNINECQKQQTFLGGRARLGPTANNLADIC
jgi:hypothetical protein